MVSKDVERAVQEQLVIVTKLVQSMASPVSARADNAQVDATEYLFVSTHLAKEFPTLIESIIVRAYHSPQATCPRSGGPAVMVVALHAMT